MNEEQFNNWYDELPILAYGELDDDELKTYMQVILTWKEQGVFISENIPLTLDGQQIFTTLEYWLILGLLSDCIEYGTSPRGAWLTDFGIDVLRYLRSANE